MVPSSLTRPGCASAESNRAIAVSRISVVVCRCAEDQAVAVDAAERHAGTEVLGEVHVGEAGDRSASRRRPACCRARRANCWSATAARSAPARAWCRFRYTSETLGLMSAVVRWSISCSDGGVVEKMNSSDRRPATRINPSWACVPSPSFTNVKSASAPSRNEAAPSGVLTPPGSMRFGWWVSSRPQPASGRNRAMSTNLPRVLRAFGRTRPVIVVMGIILRSRR